MREALPDCGLGGGGPAPGVQQTRLPRPALLRPRPRPLRPALAPAEEVAAPGAAQRLLGSCRGGAVVS